MCLAVRGTPRPWFVTARKVVAIARDALGQRKTRSVRIVPAPNAVELSSNAQARRSANLANTRAADLKILSLARRPVLLAVSRAFLVNPTRNAATNARPREGTHLTLANRPL